MTIGERMLRRPQSLWIRKALFQIHLWTGIGLGLYVLLISVSGSAIVFRNEIFQEYGKPKMVPVTGERLPSAEVRKIAQQEFPNFSITFFFEGKLPGQATEVWMEHDGKQRQRLYNPYTGKDMGDSVARQIRLVAWMADFHTNLLYSKTGRIVNGVGAILLTILCISGAIVWWPGTKNWLRSIFFSPRANWKRLNWELHSVAGFWTFALVFMWSATGVYVVWPEPFQKAINHYYPLNEYRLDAFSDVLPAPQRAPDSGTKFVLVQDPPLPLPPQRPGGASNQGKLGRKRPFFPRRYSTGDKIVRWLTYLHFGNFAGNGVKALWVVLGLAPSFLFLTGLLMWWNRVLSPRLTGESRSRSARSTALTADPTPQ
jgi:uncharacterized iron-regulated membrane protein